MPSVKSSIVKSLSTSLLPIYTNNSGVSATLKAVNAVGVADPSSWAIDQSGVASEWTSFGTNSPSFIASSASNGAYGAPFTVNLGSDRVLLIWLPHHQHVGGTNDFLGGSVVHTQIVRWDGSKYQAGPIVNVNIAAGFYPSAGSSPWQQPGNITTSFGQANLQAIALTATKVVLAIRYNGDFRLFRFNISGNSVDQSTVVNLGITGASYFNSTSALAFDLAVVPDDSNKVIVGGASGSYWQLQAFNIPDTGALTSASTLYSTALAVTSGSFTIAPLTRTAISNMTTYVVAANTVALTTISIQHFTFTSTTNTFAVGGVINIVNGNPVLAPGTPVTITNTQTTGLEAVCLSSDATPNAVVAWVDSGNYQAMYFARQTSLTQATNTSTNLSLQHSTNRGIKMKYAWGNSKAVFVGETGTLVVYNSAGAATNLIPATLSTDTTVYLPQWIPFDSRPLYSVYDPQTVIKNRNAQWLAQVGATATTVGTLTWTGNYLPYGHNYGGHYAWSDLAQCFFVGYGGRIYALDVLGNILYELPLYQLNNTSFTYQQAVRQLSVTPSGKIIAVTDTMGTNPNDFHGQRWASMNALTLGFAIQPVQSPADLLRSALLSAPVNLGYHVVADMSTYIDYAGIERAYSLFVNTGTVYMAKFDGSNWFAFGSTSVASAGNSSWHVGVRPNFRLMSDIAPDPANQQGLWKIFGSRGLNSQVNMTYPSFGSVSYNPDISYSLMTTDTYFSGTSSVSGSVYSMHRSGTLTYNMLSFYEVYSNVVRAFASVRGKMYNLFPYGWSIAGNVNNQFVQSIATKYGALIAAQNTSTAVNTVQVWTFDSINPILNLATLTSNSGNGWATLNPMNAFSWSVFANNINSQYTVVGLDTTKLWLTLNDGTNDFSLTPVSGVPLKTDGAFRSTDTYLIPAGYSVKAKSLLPKSIDLLLTVVEEN